jgi:putative oxidoreductase
MLGLPFVVALLVALAEVGGSVLLLVGGFLEQKWVTRLGAGLLVPVMVVAIAMVHWGQWSFLPSESHPMGGMEFQVALLAMQLYLIATGGGESGGGMCQCQCKPGKK